MKMLKKLPDVKCLQSWSLASEIWRLSLVMFRLIPVKDWSLINDLTERTRNLLSRLKRMKKKQQTMEGFGEEQGKSQAG